VRTFRTDIKFLVLIGKFRVTLWARRKLVSHEVILIKSKSIILLSACFLYGSVRKYYNTPYFREKITLALYNQKKKYKKYQPDFEDWYFLI